MLGPIGTFVFFVLFQIFGLAVATAATIPDRDYLQQQIPPSDLLKDPILDMYLLEGFRQRQPSTHFITDCLYVTSKAGYFVFKSPNDDPTVCGIYFLTDPDRQVELRFTFFDVPCERGGLASVVDGWELNGEIFPSATDHPLPIEDRVSEFCGKRVKKVFLSSQNAALIQYRIPAKGKGFTVLARYPKQSTPCNVLVDSTADAFTLRNYGRRINCTLSAMYPAAIRVIALGVGVNTLHGTNREIETGTVHKCDKRGLHDQAQLGGSDGLDTSNLEILDSICGVDSKPDTRGRIVGCGVTSVRLTSSGLFDNSVTVTIRPATENEIMEADLICGI
ncbi:corticotropin-releasing factor-binding protein [Cephus cinctus]|uniref:Corticotropin-releasing factor-binding protein n=1 Tax=Cephus cinctus TaxID=211228 RepID=A0AAJ7W4V1_CEPCN|nr:corticotropin-releasing factor-binding protein [Cephus cinctus]XP_024944613.1 corticotropin-releasing factor-binding protein [Cephus cinctus]XP_024944614.1 corticotropin-releasing factor-binding protein [Cephus cinctus]XP_024944615.1 corticotropin-releasing factor-binding protein [Cephus cinctus]XP_024944616.1 corticotropin-releasing factor-binding protein [Cephus cinctus]XP_024944617.1 corticotropin-releasing factor-binding protein [Cephus cinctus]